MKTIDQEQLFDTHDQAMEELKKLFTNSQDPFQRPKNIPANWKILILKEDLGLLYFNPEDNQEFVKVMQPRFEYEDEIYHEVYVVYHNRSKLIAKYFKDKLFFNQQDSEHMDILEKAY